MGMHRIARRERFCQEYVNYLDARPATVRTGYRAAARSTPSPRACWAMPRCFGTDPTPRPDAAPDSDAAQAARFHRAVQDDLLAFESRGRKPIAIEAYDIINGLKDSGVKSGWLEVRDASPTDVPDLIEGSGQGADPNVVRVAGGDKEQDKERNDARDRLPGPGNRPKNPSG